MQIVYAQQPFPNSWTSAIFLAGPTPRGDEATSWRPAALKYLEDHGFDGVVFVPEPEDGKWDGDYDDQVVWEKDGLNMADAIVFWIPRNLEVMPALTTNVEFGRWITSGKVVAGAPADAPKNRYLQKLLDIESEGHDSFTETLEATLDKAMKSIGAGALRTGGERKVPLQVWNTPPFQAWYDNLKAVGNRLDDAEQRWVFRIPKFRKVFSWVLWVKVWITAEDRYKANEYVLSRTDISTAVLYYNPLPGTDPHGMALQELLGVELVLIREFRSPGRSSDGYVHELAGGSSFKEGEDPGQVVSHEIHEETGLIIPPHRISFVGSRQLVGAFSSHKAHTFMVALTENEMNQARVLENSKTVLGVIEDTERTYVETCTVGEMLQNPNVDWSVAGMVFKALADAAAPL